MPRPMVEAPRTTYNLAMDQQASSSTAARWIGWVAVLALIALVWRALLPTLATVQYQPSSDDGYYLRYMREVGEQGLGALPGQFRFYLGDSQHWIFPPPSRVGFTLVCAVWSKLFGASLVALSYLSLASHLAMVAMVYACARRWFETYKAVLVSALVASSTLYLGLARLALTDSFISLSQAAAIWLFLDYVRDPTRTLRALAFAAVFAFAMLTKEIAVLLALPFAALAAVERWYAKREIPLVRTLVILIAPGVACVIGWVLAAGSPTTLFRVLEIVLASPSTNAYAQQFGSGAWYRYPIDELLMAPWPTLLGLAGVAIALWRWKRAEYGTLAVGMALVYVAQIGVLGFFTKNLRYVAVLEVPLRVLAVVLLWELFGAKNGLVGRALCTAAVALLCWWGWSDFERIWLEYRTYDPVTTVLVGVRGMIPTQPR